MDENTYLKERLQDQLAWFERKSSWNQKRYRFLRTMVLILSVSIPLMAGFVQEGGKYLQYGIAGAGLLIAIAEGLISIYKYHDNWVQYRASAEALKREQYLLMTGTGPYEKKFQNDQERLQTLVGRVEQILGSDIEQWKWYTGQNSK